MDVLTEFAGTFIFAVVTVGSVAVGPVDSLAGATIFGVTGAVVAAVTGAHFNPAVTVTLYLYNILTSNLESRLNWRRDLWTAVKRLVCQYSAAALAGLVVAAINYSRPSVVTNGGANWIRTYTLNAIIGEIYGTSLLLGACIVGSQRSHTPELVGLAIFMAHMLLIPVTNCSINPARTLTGAVSFTIIGNAAITPWADMWIFYASSSIAVVVTIIVAGYVTLLLDKLTPPRRPEAAQTIPV